MRIVFMGTPSFCVPSLQNLIKNGYNIAAVVTQPDRKSGRGYNLTPSPAKVIAQQNGIPVLQFEKIKSQQGVETLKEIRPDIIITAAFGQILSREILDLPKLGCINVHASLLPKYRGAAPVQWAIINGEKESGVTLMYMDVGLDTGDIISSATTSVTEHMTGGELYEKLSGLGAQLLINTLPKIFDGTANRTQQNHEESSYYPPLTKDLRRIDWNKPAREIHDLVRALNPVMPAYASSGECVYKVWVTRIKEGSALPGKVVTEDKKHGIVVGTGKGLIVIEEIQAPNSKCIRSCDFLCGREIPEQFD